MRQIFEKILEGKRLSDAERAELLLWAERAAALTIPPAQNITIVEQNITPLRTMVQAEVEGLLKRHNWIPQLSDI